jgi:CheY-like chemotaxis protein
LATTAEDGQQALQRLKTQPQAFDAVLMDIQMPVMDGLTATRLIRDDSQLKTLPVFALTAGVLDEEREAALAAGVNDFLTKPVDLDQLAATLSSLRPQPDKLASKSKASASHDQPENDPGIFPAIAGIDMERAAINSGHDRAFFLQMLALFVAEFENVGQSVRAQVDQGDLEAAARRLHNLRGNAGNLGAMDLMNAAKALELAIPQQPPDLDKQIERLCAQMRALVEASSPWLTRDAAVTPSTTDSIDPGRVDALREALTQRNLIALTIYAELEPALTGTYGRESAQKLDQAIRQLRFADALTWLQQHETRPHS